LSSGKNKYVLSFVDQLTKYPEAVPLKTTTAEECARMYATMIVAKHGSGSILWTDQGTCFLAIFFEETCRILGVKHLHSTSWHPQTNVIAEKFHRTLNAGLSHYVTENSSNWDVVLPFFMMSYNGTCHTATGFSSFYLAHGREISLPTTDNIRAKLPPEITGN
jgi:transposase InsO family protein